ncbi:MAG: hypothetical protein KDC42_00185 [Ignavibacteriae bacterium]|nr:hypothetical protein [Ignavibacteriota bacterium]
MTEKEKHLDIREKLRNLPSMKASDDFVMKLQRRINLAEAQPSTQIHKQHQEKLESGFFAKLFGAGKNAWLVPAMGVTAVVFLVFIWVYVVNQNGVNTSSGDKTQTTISQNEEQKQNESITSSDENTPGETLKTQLPGKEITSTFGETHSERDLNRGDREGGTDVTGETTRSVTPTKVVEPEKVADEKTLESPSPSMETKGLLKEEERKVDKDGMLGMEKKSAIPPSKKKKTDSLSNDDQETESLEQGKRVTRNVIDQSELEDLNEKVQDKSGVK